MASHRYRIRGLLAIPAMTLIALCLGHAPPSQAQDAAKEAQPDKPESDRRLGALKDLNGYFPFEVPKTREAWDERAEKLRRQLLVALGLWPMPERTPPKAIIHGRVDRDEYTVEKVILESWPGHYVTGSLYRPKGKGGKLAGVLCPHGHWNNGRFYDAGESGVKQQIGQGGEKYEVGGRYPLQARCVQLARMGCVVFHYDMLGYADSVQIPHSVAHGFSERRPQMEQDDAWGFFSPQAESRLQSIMGLQTYNSIRALDWLSELPEVDPQRIGVTGASGGGTQTFILTAIDSRPAAAFPAVMVSTAMQGGCTCENCSYLRVGTGNIELAALTAPRPLGMSAANDWTKEIETKGLPELKELYKLVGAPEKVMAKALLQFDHNYNYPSRAAMYEWFNKHLKLGHEGPIVEGDFKPLSIEEMSVWNEEHPKPSGDAVGEAYERKLLKQMAEEADGQVLALRPNPNRPESLQEFERSIGGGWDVLIGRRLPEPGAVRFEAAEREDKGGYRLVRGSVNYASEGEKVPALVLLPAEQQEVMAIWLDERGRGALLDTSGEPIAPVKKLLEAGISVVGLDLLYQGDSRPSGESGGIPAIKHPRNFAGFTYGYNHPLYAKRVHDVLSAIASTRDRHPAMKIHLVGFGAAGAWAAAAAAQSGEAVAGLAIDCGFEGGSFRFADQRLDSPHFLPGAVKYGDIETLYLFAKPKSLILYKPDPLLPREDERDLMLASLIVEAVAKTAEKAP